MSAFVEHHQDSIRFGYSCFDRILLNAVIQVLQYPASVVGFLKDKRQGLAAQRQVDIVEPPKDIRREEWVEPFFQKLRGQTGMAVILKSRENARVAVSFPKQGNHIELCNRFVWHYYFYLQDPDCGRMFLRICPYFPFNARVCLNGHEWLACRLREEKIRFQQCGNAFRTCGDPVRLQALADSFAPAHILACAHRWLAQLVPFFTDAERRRQGFGYRLFVSQVEYCTNLIFEGRAGLERLHERLLDLNRTIGCPDKVAIIFGRRISKRTDAGLKTQILDHDLGNPVIRSEYKSSSLKQYVRDHLILRTEATTYHTKDLGIAKNVEHLPELRRQLEARVERYLDVQQDVLETFVDRGQMERLRQATVTPSGHRTPGLKVDDRRLLALLQALVCFAYLAGKGCFRTKDLHHDAAAALGKTPEAYTLAQLRYDLAKLRAKGLVEKISGTQTYRLPSEGYRLAVVFLKLFHRIYAPLIAGILQPVPADAGVTHERQAHLDRLYSAVDRALTKLWDQIGLKQAS